MKRKPAPRKPKVSPETAAASVLAAARWKKTTPEERSRFASHVASQPRSADRCDCGVMTLKRAKARGRTWEHEPGCSFHPGAERGSHAN